MLLLRLLLPRLMVVVVVLLLVLQLLLRLLLLLVVGKELVAGELVEDRVAAGGLDAVCWYCGCFCSGCC